MGRNNNKIILVIFAVIIITASIFFFWRLSQNPKVISNLVLSGEIHEYTWLKTGENFNYAYCNDGGHDTLIFSAGDNSYNGRIIFKDSIDHENYLDKTIKIRGDKITEKIKVEHDCSGQVTIDTKCDSYTTYTCAKIINAVIFD